MRRNGDTSWIWLGGLVIVGGVALVVAASTLSSDEPGGLFGPPRVQLQPGESILLVGDSLAQGLGPPLGKIAAEAGHPFAHESQVGTRVEQWGENGRAEAALQRSGATFVIVSLGTNDAVTNAAFQERFAGRAADLVARLRAGGARVVYWVIPPTMPFATDTIVAGIQASGAAMFDSRAIEVPRTGDNIHPTIAGTAAWAAAIFESIRAG